MLAGYPRRSEGEAVGGIYSPSKEQKAAPTPPEKPRVPEEKYPAQSAVDSLYSPEIRRRSRELFEKTRTHSRQQNEWFRREFGIHHDLIDVETGCLDIRAFNSNHGGPYSSSTEQNHRSFIAQMERKFADAENPDAENDVSPEAQAENELRFKRRRDYKMDRYGISKKESVEEINRQLTKAFRREKDLKETTHLELAVMNVFTSVIGEEFLVVRSSTYDDYANGIDTVIIDKKTGTVVCTLDEVRGKMVHTASEGTAEHSARENHKARITLRDNLRGGRQLDYGIQFEKKNENEPRRLVLGKIEHLPILYVSVLGSELEKVLKSTTSPLRRARSPELVTQTELNFFDKIIEHLSNQALELVTRPGAKTENSAKRQIAEKRATDLHASIERMKALRIKKFGRPQR